VTPLHVVAHLQGGICLPNGPIALDALLTWAEAMRRELPPPATAQDCQDLPLPIARSTCGRYWLASFGAYEPEEHEVDWTNRRFPIAEAQMLAEPKLRRVNMSAGACKSYRLPRERMHLRGDRIDWWAIGDADGVRELLMYVGYLGKRRGVGLGRVREWRVGPCESWGEGFPVVRDGYPTRALPLDVSGIADDAERAMHAILPPYWAHTRRVEAWVPSWVA